MSAEWIVGVGRCASCRRLHVVKTRHPEAPRSEHRPLPGAVGIGSSPVSAFVTNDPPLSIHGTPLDREGRPSRRRKREPKSERDSDVPDAVARSYRSTVRRHLIETAEERRAA